MKKNLKLESSTPVVDDNDNDAKEEIKVTGGNVKTLSNGMFQQKGFFFKEKIQ